MDDADLAVKHEQRAEARARRLRMLAKPAKPSASHCVACGDSIAQARQAAVPGVELCIECQTIEEKGNKR